MHAYRGPRPTVRADGRKFANLELAGITGDGTFSGYASVFGEVDLGKNRIERGARGVRVLYQHDPNEPIGAWTMIREDARGLYVEGRLTPGVGRAGEVFSLMKSGALDGLSIGFRTVKARTDAKTGVRRVSARGRGESQGRSCSAPSCSSGR